MTNDRMPVTPAVIRWARDHAGVSLRDAQSSFGDIEGWESGISQPTYRELEDLADQYKVPIAVFFFPEPPKLPPLSRSFRTLPAEIFNQLPSKIRLLIRSARAFQLDMEELLAVRETVRDSLLQGFSFSTEMSIDAMARSVRDHLGVSTEDQLKWRDASTAFNEWRNVFFRSGVFVIKDQVDESGFNGFCLYDRRNPLIYVNRRSAHEHQILTLFYMLGHLLFGTSGLECSNIGYLIGQGLAPGDSHEQQFDQINERCLDFASEALIPSTQIERCLGNMKATEQTAATLASRFHVSRELIYRRFRDTDLASGAAYQAAIMKRASQQSTQNVSSNLFEKVISHFGRNYVDLILSRYYANQIDEEQLARYLEIKVRELEAFKSCYE